MVRVTQRFPSTPEFEKHADNLAEIRKFRIQIERLHKSAIRRNAAPEISALSRTQYLTIGIEAEAILRKIVADPTGFNDVEREVIWSVRSKVDQWLQVLDLAFRRHYQILLHRPLDSALAAIPLTRYEELHAVVDDDLRPIVEQRNKIAHGQWVWQLKSRKENEFISGGPQSSTPDYLTLSLYSKMLDEIASLVLDLVVSRPTFEREFNSGYARFDAHRLAIAGNANGQQYRAFVARLMATKR
ncbi:hypothetical protein [Mycobacterium sp. 236(2023)]|uniref:hypothetical protein n=1 Tax=Mycobacterium sp. 236(2023) TaxID=3038163 RepID=UPI002415963D|nr:hypothetical protein [Mycobacterium sp. 236(2023)]MDG4666059.1 hypothetical protein [Mycobacterium sp. 236(2023)]